MKWPWSKSESQPLPTGRAIQTPLVMPQHAEHLRAFNFARAQKTRMYDAAVTNQFNQDFPSTYGSADAELLTSLYTSRNRARTLVKDYPIAKGIVRNDSNNVVGEDAFRLEMKVAKPGAKKKPGEAMELDSEINEMIELAWKEAGEPEHCTVRKTWSRLELYHMVENEVITAGGVLGRHFRGFNNDFGYAIDCLEIDRLDQNYMGKSEAGNQIRFSIEFDAYSAPVRYWLLTRHPGDVFGYANKYPGMRASQFREPVDAKDIIAFFNMRSRAEQSVGMTELDSIIQQLHRDRQFDIAHVYAAIWASCKPFFIVQEFPTGLQYAGDPSMQAMFPGLVGGSGTNETTTGAGDTKGGGVNKVKVQEPASGEILPWGQKPMLIDPKFPIDSATSFKKNNLEAVAMGAGQSYAEVSADYSGLSFSAARMAMLPSRDNYKVKQKHMICGFVQSHFREWLKQAMLSTYFEERFGVTLSMSRYKEFCRAAHFHGKRWGYINPLQDIQADVIAKEALLKSPQEIRAESENGGSIEDVYRQIKEAKTMADDLEITPPEPDVTTPTLSKGSPTQADEGGATKTGGKNVMNKNRKYRGWVTINGAHVLIGEDDGDSSGSYTKTLFRASDNEGTFSGAHFSENEEDANAYTNNPGFGGDTVREYTVQMKSPLELSQNDAHDLKSLAQRYAQIKDLDATEVREGWKDSGYDTVFHVLENAKGVNSALKEHHDFIKFKDDFPENSITWKQLKN